MCKQCAPARPAARCTCYGRGGVPFTGEETRLARRAFRLFLFGREPSLAFARHKWSFLVFFRSPVFPLLFCEIVRFANAAGAASGPAASLRWRQVPMQVRGGLLPAPGRPQGALLHARAGSVLPTGAPPLGRARNRTSGQRALPAFSGLSVPPFYRGVAAILPRCGWWFG